MMMLQGQADVSEVIWYFSSASLATTHTHTLSLSDTWRHVTALTPWLWCDQTVFSFSKLQLLCQRSVCFCATAEPRDQLLPGGACETGWWWSSSPGQTCSAWLTVNWKLQAEWMERTNKRLSRVPALQRGDIKSFSCPVHVWTPAVSYRFFFY